MQKPILADYLKLARIDHWFKNLFVLPGTGIAILLNLDIPDNFLLKLCIALLSTCFISSANYVINEWLDRTFDMFHPEKKFRASIQKHLNAKWIYFEYATFAFSGLLLAIFLSGLFFILSCMLLSMGLIYNAPPIRTKERVYLDVLSESLNNPLRFMLGWAVVTTQYIPPSSILFAYWMGGAFLMGIKRFAEYRYIGDPEKAGLYRRSFKYYTEQSLLISSFFYGLLSSFFLGVFLIKYRIEYLLTLPLFAILFTWYFKIGFDVDSSAQHPEKLYHEKWFMTYVTFLCLIIVLLSLVNLPWLNVFLDTTLIPWN